MIEESFSNFSFVEWLKYFHILYGVVLRDVSLFAEFGFRKVPLKFNYFCNTYIVIHHVLFMRLPESASPICLMSATLFRSNYMYI